MTPWAALMALVPAASLAESPDAEFFRQLQAQVVLVRTATGSGSGVILDAGRIVTGCHVVEDHEVIDMELEIVPHAEASPLPVTLVARDPEHDICLLGLDSASRLPADARRARIADTPVEVGDRAYVAGAPKGLSDSVTQGIISKLRRHGGFPPFVQPGLWEIFELCSQSEQDEAWFIQTSAEFTNGSSGGGLFNSDGQLIGIPAFVVPATGMAIRFAVPAEHVRTLADQDPDEALGDLVSHLADTGKIKQAHEASGRIHSAYRLAHALEDIAMAELSAGTPDDAVRTLVKAVAAAPQIDDRNRRAKRLEALARSLAKAGAFSLAIRTAAGIDVLEDQAEAFAAVAKAQARLEFFTDAKRTVPHIRDPHIRAAAGDYVTGREIRAWVKSGDLARALHAAETLQSLENRIGKLQRIARAYGRLNNVPAARRTYAKAIGLAGFIRDLSDRSEILIDIAHDQAHEDFPANAKATVDAAVQTAGQISNPAAGDEAFLNIVEVLADMPAFMTTMFRAAERITDSRKRDSATRNIAETLADLGRFQEASQLAQRIKDLSIRGDAQQRIVRELVDAEKWGTALGLAKSIGDPASRAAALRELATARADSGEIYGAIRIAEQIRDPAAEAAVYVFVIQAGMYDDRINRNLAHDLMKKAERSAQRSGDPGERAKILVELAVLYVELGDSAQADRIVETLGSSRRYARGLRELSKAHARLGNFAAAEERIDRMPMCAGRQREWATEDLAAEKERVQG